MKFKLMLMLAAILLLQNVYAQLPDVFLINPQHIAQKKLDFKKGNAGCIKAVAELVKIADKYLDAKSASVMEKALTPPSGTKHDYMSMAPYFWPNPAKADGLPYIRKDGQRNPEIKKISDHEMQSELNSRCEYLSLAYYFTGDEKYAAKADELLKVWFIDPETKMNPNLNYAQAIRGVNDGRGIGIIETRALANLTDWMGLLAGSKSFTAAHLSAIKSWYAQYLNWMLTSKNGKDEHRSKNNHGTHYDTQVVSFALFTGDKALAAKILTESKNRIAVQIEPDGKQPLELARTNALSYSSMNLDGWINLATLGDRAGVDLWHYTTADGRSIRKALDWLLPFALGQKAFPYQEISSYNKDQLYHVLLLCAQKYHEPAYAKAAADMRENRFYVDDVLYN